MKKVFIWRNEVLPISETFIRSQAAALRNFEATFVGLKKVAGLSVPGDPILLTVDNSLQSKLKRAAFKQFGLAPGFLKRLERERPELIHAHFALDGSLAMQVSRELRIPLVVTLHGYDVTTTDAALSKDRDGLRYLKRRERLWEHASQFLCSCEYILNRAADAGFPRHKLEVLYSGHRLKEYTPPTEPRNPNLVLYVGRLVEKKGGPYLLKAVAKAAETCPEIELAIIGSGPLEESMRAEAAQLGIKCRFLGRLMDPEPGNTVHDWMRRARVFCAPSITASDGNTEGQPAVFVEAHALGLPAVSFQTAGIGEAVLHGETGLLAPEKNIDILAQYLVKFLSDQEFWNACSERGRSWVWERFDLDVLTEQLESVYRRTLSGSPKPEIARQSVGNKAASKPGVQIA